MTKSEFLDYLEKRLHVLNNKERDDILGEYAQHIELKIASGLSEDAAIHDFGNLEELTAEILDAYNVNPEYSKKITQFNGKKLGADVICGVRKAGNGISTLCGKSMQSMKGMFSGKTRSILARVFLCLIMIGILTVIYLPLAAVVFWLADISYSVFGYPLDQIASGVIIVVFHGAYLLLSLIVLYFFVLRGGTHENKGSELLARFRKAMSLHVSPERSDGDLPRGFLHLSQSAAIKRVKESVNRKPKSEHHFVESIVGFIKVSVAVCLKGIVACVLAPLLVFQLFLVITFGSLIVLCILGYPFVGLTVMAFGVLLSGFAFLWYVGSFLFGRKVREEV